MKIIGQTNKSDIATVYIAKTGEDKYLEFVESVQPPYSIQEKWVLIISTLYGCPISCSFCDCGYYYRGKVSKNDMLNQIDFLVKLKFVDKNIPIEKFKIQFARMGEPSFNMEVIDVLKEISYIYKAPGLIPSLSTVAPLNREHFFDELLNVKKELYPKNFQLQFSIHSTDEIERDEIIPAKKWNFSQIAEYGDKFYDYGGKKITLNFALSKDYHLNPKVLINYFNPDRFIIKITPINPTHRSKENSIDSYLNPGDFKYDIIELLKLYKYETILSIGEWEENLIGSNCGQFVLNHLNNNKQSDNSYLYDVLYNN